MTFFDAFARLFTGAARPEPAMRLTSRGEGITYRAGGREVEIGFMAGKEPRLLVDTVGKWSSGERLTDAEKAAVFAEALVFVPQHFHEKAIVVINDDSPAKGLWEKLCAEHGDHIARVEHTTDRDQLARVRDMIDSIAPGKVGIIVDGKKMSGSAEAEEALARLREKRRQEEA